MGLEFEVIKIIIYMFGIQLTVSLDYLNNIQN